MVDGGVLFVSNLTSSVCSVSPWYVTNNMNQPLYYDVAVWLTHVTEVECEFIIRSNQGQAFYCHISPSQFANSPQVTEHYFKCLDFLRLGEEHEDFCMEDACDWLLDAFRPLVTSLRPSPTTPSGYRRPTLAQYLSPQQFFCTLDVTNEILQPRGREGQGDGWDNKVVRADKDYLEDLEEWTQLYDPSDVEICYDRPQDVLIKRPSKVVVPAGEDGTYTPCFFKEFGLSFGPRRAGEELTALNKIVMAPLSPEALVCRLHGVVRTDGGLAGMLFTWIDKKSVLSQATAEESPPELRQRWATQITKSLAELHYYGIIWGDAKADNILIDRNDNAWIIDFGGSYTVGWVDKEKAGTWEGDMQGLKKILEMLK